ncbi:hypothetical protein LCGC14_2923390, partial [marine sediment metagenome]
IYSAVAPANDRGQKSLRQYYLDQV